ncbi:hypothetical protein EDD29_3548 [Actinocorallia herbida]|uniref:Uncharacterized protein n=1 Tax=Actinocorallia herbida TaxID=58109 RepID=A0A3N1CXJ0_9ACTN|nr:hypothetical protein [Actinocorallia herbida]ROO85991.1 hypothetical protein EDD29_3548 [Actinocorallia herbida]
MEPDFFEHVGEVVRGAAPRDLGPLRLVVHRNGVKVWFGDPAPAKEHYEAQLIRADLVEDAREQALEIGFHTEHPKPADNEAVLRRLLDHEDRWRPALGAEPVVGPFLGPPAWRRISELWLDPEPDADLAFEAGIRLTDYLKNLEPHRT